MLSSYPTAIAKDTAVPKISSWNQKVYRRLQAALNLNLRRQIFIAVCDDLSLRNLLAEQLQAEFGYPHLVNIALNLKTPNPLAQIAQWLAQQRSPLPAASITFQILGAELLAREPAAVQALFLRHLQAIERSLPQLESSLVLWLSRPWFYSIQQSAPKFWHWRTAVFEFEGEPTPVTAAIAPQPEVEREPAPRNNRVQQEVKAPPADLWRLLAEDLELQEQIAAEQPGEEVKAPNALPALPAVQTLEDLEQLQLQSQPPEVLAEAYLGVGNHYRDRIERGEGSAENLQIAIQAYEKGLEWLETAGVRLESTTPSDILNDVGNLYWMLARATAETEPKLSCLERGIQSYQLALAKLTAETAPHTYAMIQNNLGAAYGDLAYFCEPAENLQMSIRAYEEALRYRSPEAEPLKYASTQNNLGTAYWHLAQQSEARRYAPGCLQQAIAAYNAAAAIYDPQTEPLNWAMIQNNLGTAYWNLAQYQQPIEYLQAAVDAYGKALQYRTAAAMPAACAATQNNLGTAYWHLAHHWQDEPAKQREYLLLCVQAYEQAIALAKQLRQSQPPIAVNFDLFAAENNLGLARYQMAMERRLAATDAEQSAHLEAALHHHLQALQGLSDRPESYQTAFNYVIKTIRAFYQERGLAGQNLALSQVPGQLLPEILRRL